MDGFEDNTGIIVLGATNRPGAIDSALIRPGRFDRIIYMPLPDSAGRAKILQVRAGVAVGGVLGFWLRWWFFAHVPWLARQGQDCAGACKD